MPYEQRDGQGSLFRVEPKESAQDRDYNGSIRINGQDYWLSGYLKTSKAGKKWLSLSAKLKLDKGAIAVKEAIDEGEPHW